MAVENLELYIQTAKKLLVLQNNRVSKLEVQIQKLRQQNPFDSPNFSVDSYEIEVGTIQKILAIRENIMFLEVKISDAEKELELKNRQKPK